MIQGRALAWTQEPRPTAFQRAQTAPGHAFLLWQCTGRGAEKMLSTSQARKGRDVHSLEGPLPTCPWVAWKMPSLGQTDRLCLTPCSLLPSE